jgi:hypothetical protein
VAEIGHRALTESAFGFLDEETMLLQLGKYKMDVTEVLRPGMTIN